MAVHEFLEVQRRAFAEADERHLEWQVANPLVARTEQALLEGLLSGSVARRFLEVGSGEGGNLLNLAAARGALPPVTIGLDLFLRKVRFGQRRAAPARFVCGDALQLPFASGAFDVVLCRDLLHHVEDRGAVLRELRRVCRPGGEVWIVEPNGRNPLIALFAILLRHERGQLATTPGRMEALASELVGPATVVMKQPLPVFRALVHYSFGWPALGGRDGFGRLMASWDRVFARVLPRRFWAYIVLRIVTSTEVGSECAGSQARSIT
jgi:SAM-dependent methyltransferase